MNLLFFQVRLFTVRVRLKLRASVALSPVFSAFQGEKFSPWKARYSSSKDLEDYRYGVKFTPYQRAS